MIDTDIDAGCRFVCRQRRDDHNLLFDEMGLDHRNEGREPARGRRRVPEDVELPQLTSAGGQRQRYRAVR